MKSELFLMIAEGLRLESQGKGFALVSGLQKEGFQVLTKLLGPVERESNQLAMGGNVYVPVPEPRAASYSHRLCHSSG